MKKESSMNGFFFLLQHDEDKNKNLLILDEKAELHSCLECLKQHNYTRNEILFDTLQFVAQSDGSRSGN